MKRWIDGWMLGLLLLVMVGGAHAVDVERGINGLIRAAGLGDTAVGVYVVDLDDGQVLASIDADEPMIPASNMKLLTTAAAMDLLGAEFVFRTELGLLAPGDMDPSGQTDATDPGSDKPSLLIRGDGDPAFGDPVLLEQHGLVIDDLLNQWLDAIVATGVKQFDAIYLDDRVFDRRFIHPTWPADDLNDPWCAQVAGINFYRNTLDVTPIPTRSGEAPRIELFPASPFLQTSNLATSGKKDSFWTQRNPGTNVLTFRGSVKHRPGSPWRVTLHDPPTYFGQLLKHKLADRGVRVGDVRRVSDDAAVPDGVELLHVVQTTLPLVITRTNQDSQNMFSEALFKRIGRSVTGGPGSWESGSAAMRIFLREAIGPQASVARVADGSGLSRENRVTARMLVDLLKRMHANPDTAEPFRESLAFGGNDADGQYHGGGRYWTPRRRFDDLPPDHWVFGKSGYIRGVSTLSGYLIVPRPEGSQRTDPHVIAFSFLFNNYKPPLYNHHLKKLQDQMVKLIGTSVTEPARLGG